MNEPNKVVKTTPKQKRAKHANAQASYMQRKREEGKEWIATWVPKEAKETFRLLAKKANEDPIKPSDALLEQISQQVQGKIPSWCQNNEILLQLWAIAGQDVDFADLSDDTQVDDDLSKEKKEKKKKKKKK